MADRLGNVYIWGDAHGYISAWTWTELLLTLAPHGISASLVLLPHNIVCDADKSHMYNEVPNVRFFRWTSLNLGDVVMKVATLQLALQGKSQLTSSSKA